MKQKAVLEEYRMCHRNTIYQTMLLQQDGDKSQNLKQKIKQKPEWEKLAVS
jgi:hypothetical protein